MQMRCSIGRRLLCQLQLLHRQRHHRKSGFYQDGQAQRKNISSALNFVGNRIYMYLGEPLAVTPPCTPEAQEWASHGLSGSCTPMRVVFELLHPGRPSSSRAGRTVPNTIDEPGPYHTRPSLHHDIPTLRQE
jgi:hypothetical protein